MDITATSSAERRVMPRTRPATLRRDTPVSLFAFPFPLSATCAPQIPLNSATGPVAIH